MLLLDTFRAFVFLEKNLKHNMINEIQGWKIPFLGGVGRWSMTQRKVPGSDGIAYLIPQLKAWIIPASQLSYFTSL